MCRAWSRWLHPMRRAGRSSQAPATRAVTLISTGAASWVLNEPSLEFHEGARMRASVIGATNIWMEGPGSQLRPRHAALDARGRSFIWHRRARSMNGRSTLPASLARRVRVAPGRTRRPDGCRPDQRACKARPASTARPEHQALPGHPARRALLAAPPVRPVHRGTWQRARRARPGRPAQRSGRFVRRRGDGQRSARRDRGGRRVDGGGEDARGC